MKSLASVASGKPMPRAASIEEYGRPPSHDGVKKAARGDSSR